MMSFGFYNILPQSHKGTKPHKKDNKLFVIPLRLRDLVATFQLDSPRRFLKTLRNLLTISLLFYGAVSLYAQDKKPAEVITSVEVSPKIVIVGQPVDVKVGVFTSTYFTKAAEFEKITIPNVFIIPYLKPLSTNKQVNGKIYFGVEYSYKLFPAKDGKIIFPSLEVTVYTPDEGDYKANPRQVRLPRREIEVKAVPAGYSRNSWLVATAVNLSESWSRDLKTMQVGDALERKIVTTASGTVAALIPPLQFDTLSWGSLYPKQAVLEDDQQIESISAKRVEHLTYLAEKPGTYAIPPITVSWWNVSRNEFYKKTLPAKQIIISENPDLAILRTMQDSLNALKSKGQNIAPEKDPLKILGLRIWQFIILILVIVLLLVLIWKIILLLQKKLKQRRQSYRESEQYYFANFKKACQQKNLANIRHSLTSWIDKLYEGQRLPAISEFIQNYGSEELLQLFNLLETNLFKANNTIKEFSGEAFYQQIRNARLKYMKKKEFGELTGAELPQLNP